MKKIFTSLFLIGISFSTFAQIPTAGQVAYYPFNGNTNDQSGNNYNGTVYGATLTTDRFGNANSAYSFDGINDYIDIGNSTSFTLNNFTISVWVNEQGDHNGGDNSGVVAGKCTADAGEIGYRIVMDNADNKSYCVVSQMGVIQPGTGGVNTLNTFINNQWSHIVAIKSNDSLIIYKNGNLENITTGITASINTDNNFIIGKADAPGNYYFYGYIDNLRIYNRSLDTTEINSLYNENTSSSNCLIAQYNFTGNAADSSGNGLNGTVYGATLVPDRFGSPNSAYNFDASLLNYIEVLDNSLFNFQSSNQMSISFWIKTVQNTPLNDHIFLSKQTSSGSNQLGWNCSMYDPDIYMLVKNGSSGVQGYNTSSSNGILNNIWHHIVYTFDNGNAKAYINGVLTNSSTSTAIIGDNSGNLNIGKANWSNDPATSFTGSLDDINIYNCAITQQEIDSLFNDGSVGITQINNSENISVYPNPSNGKFTLHLNTKLNNATLSIYNVLGESVFKSEINNETSEINLSSQPEGIYFLTIYNGTKVYNEKLIKQ